MRNGKTFFLFSLIIFLSGCGNDKDTQDESSFLPYQNSSSMNLSDSMLSTTKTMESSASLAFSYLEKEDGYALAGRGECTDNNIVVPSSYQGKKVVKVEENAFEGDANLTSVVLPDTIKILGKYSFSECVSLESIHLSSTLEDIQDECFYWCHQLTNIDLPSSLRHIGQLVFFDSGIQRKNKPNEPFYVSSFLIDGKGASGEYIVKQGTLGLADHVFYQNTDLISLTVPKSVSFIGDAALDFTSSLQRLSLPSSLNPGNYIHQHFNLEKEEDGISVYLRK